MTGLFDTLANSGPLLRDAVQSRNLKVLASMLGPAFRGFLQQRGKNEPLTPVRLGYNACFDWRYNRGEPEMARLYEAAKASQWNASKDLDWSIEVDPESAERPLFPTALLPLATHPGFVRLTPREQGRQRR